MTLFDVISLRSSNVSLSLGMNGDGQLHKARIG